MEVTGPHRVLENIFPRPGKSCKTRKPNMTCKVSECGEIFYDDRTGFEKGNRCKKGT